jgi:ABC-type multidrug transport system fused ATPase/permease subunit
VLLLSCLPYTLYSPGAKESISVMLPLFIAAAYRVMPSMNRMLIALGSIKGFQYVIQIIKDGLQPIPNTSDQNKEAVLSFENHIEFRDVSYQYPSGKKLSVDSLNLKVQKGQKIGIIGKSGSGKTTIINILLRFLKEQQGGLYVDGKKISVNEENQWRQLIGYVKQSVFIIDGDFYENIAFGVARQEIDIEKLNKVLVLSKLDEVVEKSPQGLNSNIGENGTKLSGGQRQRIAIARALYKDAQILVFDEATSALDTQTEKEITESIEAISKENKTMFIIAHRITTLKNCDVIYDMADGKIIGSYSYEEIAKTILEN